MPIILFLKDFLSHVKEPHPFVFYAFMPLSLFLMPLFFNAFEFKS